MVNGRIASTGRIAPTGTIAQQVGAEPPPTEPIRREEEIPIEEVKVRVAKTQISFSPKVMERIRDIEKTGRFSRGELIEAAKQLERKLSGRRVTFVSGEGVFQERVLSAFRELGASAQIRRDLSRVARGRQEQMGIGLTDVRVSKEVFVDGLGFSVAPELQKEFIKKTKGQVLVSRERPILPSGLSRGELEGVVIKEKPFSFGDDRPSSAISRGLPPVVTKTEAAALMKESVPETFIIAPDDSSIATETGIILGGLGLQRADVPRFGILSDLGLLPTEAKSTTIFNIEQAEIAKEALKRQKQIEKKLQEDPESFIGKEGVKVEETAQGRKIILTEKFFEKEFKDLGKLAKIRAKEKFRVLPRETRFPLGGKEFTLSVPSFAVGVGELAGTLALSLGDQTFKPGEAPTPPISFKDSFVPSISFGKTFKLGGPARELQTLPFSLERTIGKVGLGLAVASIGVGQFRATKAEFGLGRALIETAEGLTPLRLGVQTFVPKISRDDPKDVVSFKFSKDSRILFARGKTDPIFVSQTQIKGITATEEFTPVLQFRFGEFTPGLRTVTSRGFVFGKATPAELARQFNFGEVALDLPGVRGVTATQRVKDVLTIGAGKPKTLFELTTAPSLDIDITPKGIKFPSGKTQFEATFDFKLPTRDALTFDLTPTGGVTQRVGGFTFFRGGRLISTKEGLANIRGIEFDLTPSPSGVRIFRSGTGPRTPLSTTFQIQEPSFEGVTGITGAIFKPTPPPKISVPSKLLPVIVPGAVPGVTTKSVFFGPQFAPSEDVIFTSTDIGRTIFGVDLGLGLRRKTKLKTKTREDTLFKALITPTTSTILKPVAKEDTILRAIQKTQQRQRQKQKQKQRTRQVISPFGIGVPTTPFTPFQFPIPIPPADFPFFFPGLALPKERRKKTERGFNVIIGGRKVNKNPLTRQRARDMRNYLLDTSLARTGSIKQTRGKIKEPSFRIPQNYADFSSHKFRDYRIKKGKRIPLTPGKVIERRGKTLDTIQEVRKITLARRLKQLQRSSGSLFAPTRRRKNGKKKKTKN